MKYKQLQMILEPTSIEELFKEDTNDDTLAEAMLFNWDHIGSLITEDDHWKCLFELPKDFYFDNIVNEYDNYKGWEHRSLIIKIKNRYFCYNYINGKYDDDILDWKEVYPIPCITYSIEYVGKNEKTDKIINISPHYTELYGDPDNE